MSSNFISFQELEAIKLLLCHWGENAKGRPSAINVLLGFLNEFPNLISVYTRVDTRGDTYLCLDYERRKLISECNRNAANITISSWERALKHAEWYVTVKTIHHRASVKKWEYLACSATPKKKIKLIAVKIADAGANANTNANAITNTNAVTTDAVVVPSTASLNPFATSDSGSSELPQYTCEQNFNWRGEDSNNLTDIIENLAVNTQTEYRWYF